MSRQPNPEPRQPARRRGIAIAVGCAAFAFGMVGAAYAAVPLYQLFCQVTGYGGTTQRAEAGPAQALDREVSVRFDSNASPGVPWDFQPEERELRVKLGETRQTAYRVKNLSDRRVTAQATFNVTPVAAGAYFNKISCFCFTDQTLEPGEETVMPVVFFVDPKMIEQEELAGAPTITLSYTFFPAETATPLADALDAAAGPKDNL